MDIETLTNHISKLGKDKFNITVELVFNELFNFTAINIDGKSDGGTDLITVDGDGSRTAIAYQITTQKSDIKGKAWRDARKVIDKLGVKSYFFIPTYNLSEIESRQLEADITTDLGLATSVYNPKVLAGLIISKGLTNKLIDELDYPLPRDYKPNGPDYRERALHSYSLHSDDSRALKEGIYNESILFVLSEKGPTVESELIIEVSKFLGIVGDASETNLSRRIGALFGNQLVARNENNEIVLSDKSSKDIEARKRIYEAELQSLVSAQTDLLQKDYGIDWTLEDSKNLAVWIAEAFIADRMSNLEELKIRVTAHPLYDIQGDGVAKIQAHLSKKGIKKEDNGKALSELLELASNHPLITKITRASMYIALEGSSPIQKAKSLGATRWSQFNVMIEPSVAIPYICSRLYNGYVNSFFDLSVKAVRRVEKIGGKACIPFFYINECAGHLLRARKYCGLDFDADELKYSGNAFIANYFALKSEGIPVPDSLLNYLATFSSAIKSERADTKSWIRSIMTDLQSVLKQTGIEFVYVPLFKEEDCIEFEKEYAFQLDHLSIEKPKHLIQHDIWALQYSQNRIVGEDEHWIILTYDKSLITFSKAEIYSGHVTTPAKFIDITESTKPLSETHFVSLVHSVATYSERTLAAGARVMDRIVKYASAEFQNWEFKEKIEQFKTELIESIDLDLDSLDLQMLIDRKTDKFLKSQGVKSSAQREEQVDD
jgi:hypothetical protein